MIKHIYALDAVMSEPIEEILDQNNGNESVEAPAEGETTVQVTEQAPEIWGDETPPAGNGEAIAMICIAVGALVVTALVCIGVVIYKIRKDRKDERK